MNAERMDAPCTYRNVLIVADIEGSSGCCSYAGSAFFLRLSRGLPAGTGRRSRHRYASDRQVPRPGSV